jgi:hypothetical protein
MVRSFFWQTTFQEMMLSATDVMKRSAPESLSDSQFEVVKWLVVKWYSNLVLEQMSSPMLWSSLEWWTERRRECVAS